MDVVERLTLESARSETLIACEHRHRYQFAQRLCSNRRVLDLCCGSGYGSEILATGASEVLGVDSDSASIDSASAAVASRLANVTFRLADAIEFLGSDQADRFDSLVCFEGLEHLRDLPRALDLLRQNAERGMQIVASVPNSELFGERNPFHLTHFGYDQAMAAFAAFPEVVMVPQFLAEGSLICPPGARETEVDLSLEDRDEPEYANHFIFCVNFSSGEVAASNDGRLRLSAAPVFNRFAEGIKHANEALARENARLARDRLGRAGSGAASALIAVPREVAELQARHDAWRDRALVAENRVMELQAELPATNATAEPGVAWGRGIPSDQIVPLASLRSASEAAVTDDPNSWQERHRRAAEHLLPWVEQTMPLAGKTVLEYGCGNGAVSCAFAARAEHLIGVDIDPGWIELARRSAAERGIDNVDFELHPVEAVLEAVRERAGEIDVFLCYAVLEHLTVQERLAVLRLAREVVRPDGIIVVCETPNRLIYFDHHTAQMPFFHALPDELSLEYVNHSRRGDFRAAIGEALKSGREAGLEAIARWGRGVSFHEFELVFNDLSKHVIASNYDPLLLPERPFHADEVILARYLERWRPDLPPVFSRYWLDLILTPEPFDRRPPWFRPWPLQTSESWRVAYTAQDTLRLADANATAWVSLPQPSQRLLVSAQAASGPLQLRARTETMLSALSSATREVGTGCFATFVLPEPAHRVELSADQACELVFVGYEA